MPRKTDTITPWIARTKKELEALQHMKIYVGIQGENDGELLTYAAAHEYGATIQGTTKKGESFTTVIPERSFIRASFNANRERIQGFVSSAVNKIIREGWTAQQAAKEIGANCLSVVQEYFNTSITPPTSPETMKRKSVEQTLFDSGRLYASLTYRVEEGGP